MKQLSENSNLVPVLESMIEGEVIQANQIVCDGKIKASLLVNLAAPDSRQHIIEIVENELVHYQDEGDDQFLKQRF